MQATSLPSKIALMGRSSHYIFGFEAEPADERPTGYGSTNFGRMDPATMSTTPAAWMASEHSTFGVPSHAIERVEARRRHGHLKALLFAVALLTVSAVVCVAALVSRS